MSAIHYFNVGRNVTSVTHNGGNNSLDGIVAARGKVTGIGAFNRRPYSRLGSRGPANTGGEVATVNVDARR